MRALLLDPRLFNYVICALYATNFIQFELRAYAGWDRVMLWNGLYWLAALSITVVVTWGKLK